MKVRWIIQGLLFLAGAVNTHIARAAGDQPPQMYFVRGGSAIQRANLDGSGLETIVNAPVAGIALDAGAGKLYWTDPVEDAVRRSDLNGTGVETLEDFTGSTPGKIAIDSTGGKMYFVRGGSAVQRANLDGSSLETVLSRPIAGIALDTDAGKLYWTDPVEDSVLRSNLNGTGAETILDFTGSTPGRIAIDPNGKMYFVRGGGGAQRSNLDGSGLETVLNTPIAGIALDIGAGKLYWTDPVEDSILRANLDGTGAATLEDFVGSTPGDIALLLPEPASCGLMLPLIFGRIRGRDFGCATRRRSPKTAAPH